ncbi:MAG: DUF4388 domain-containing protein, partial [Nitriliruptoraceae bacterium]
TSKSGQLSVWVDDQHGRIELDEGRVRTASNGIGGNWLPRRLIARGRLDADTLREIAEGGALPDERELVSELVARSKVGADEAAELLAEQVLDTVFDLLVWTTGRFRFEGAPVSSDALARTWSIPELLEQMNVRLEAHRVLAELEGPVSEDLPTVPPSPGDGADATSREAAPTAAAEEPPLVTAGDASPLATAAKEPPAATSEPGHPTRGGLSQTVDEDLIERLITGIEARQ